MNLADRQYFNLDCDYFNNEFWNQDHNATVDSTTIDAGHQRLHNTGLMLICNTSWDNLPEEIKELDGQGYKVTTICETAYTVCGELSPMQVSLWGKEKLSKKLSRLLHRFGLLPK